MIHPLILSAILAVVGGLLTALIWKDWIYTLLSIAYFMALLFFCAMLGNNMTNDAPRVKFVEKYTDIVAVNDSTKISGKISGGLFVITGYVKEDIAYYFYKPNNGGYSRDFITGNVTIFEDTENAGYINRIWDEIPDDYMKEHNGWISDNAKWTLKGYEIHIPQGTIDRQFSLDNK